MKRPEGDLLRQHVRERFRHDWWANGALLAFLERQTRARRSVADDARSERACHLFGHLLATELFWLGRIEDSSDQTLPAWRGRSLPELRAQLDRAQTKWDVFLEGLEPANFARPVSYRNVVGEQHENTLIQIIAHVLNHSAHHRAQIVAALRELDLEPPGLDYILYLRLPAADM